MIEESLQIYGLEGIPIKVISSPKRRTVGIIIRVGFPVTVRVPKRVSKKQIYDFVSSKRDWILEKVKHFNQRVTEQIKKMEYKSGETITHLGKRYEIVVTNIAPQIINKNQVTIEGDKLLVKNHHKSSTKIALTAWFEEQAIEVFSKQLNICYDIFKVYYRHDKPILRLRKMKSRWGSMSNAGIMTLNTMLIHAPIECINYVIMHELCHLRIKGHDKRFYKMQEQFVPNWKELKKTLNQFSSELKVL